MSPRCVDWNTPAGVLSKKQTRFVFRDCPQRKHEPVVDIGHLDTRHHRFSLPFMRIAVPHRGSTFSSEDKPSADDFVSYDVMNDHLK